MDVDEDFRQFVVARQRSLLRTAWLLTGDWASAEDLVQTALMRAWPHWRRVSRTGGADAYVPELPVLSLGVVIAVLVTSSLVVGVQALAPSEGRSTLAATGDGRTVSALDRRQSLDESDDSGLRNLGSEGLRHPGQASRLGEAGPNEVWLAETADGRLCLAAVDGPRLSYHCRTTAEVTGQGLYLLLQEAQGTSITVLVVAPDGYTSARAGDVSVQVDTNLAVLVVDDRSGQAILSGPGLSDRTVPFS